MGRARPLRVGRGAGGNARSGQRAAAAGKTFLLDAVCEALNSFYFGAIEATGSESLRLLGARLGEHLKLGAAG